MSECTCVSERERLENERTGAVKLYHFEPGFDENGEPCPVHDPGKKAAPKQSAADARRERGNQLRALVVSWTEQTTFVDALREQQATIDAGTFTPNEDWSVMADEILGGYMSQPRMTAWDGDKKDDGPKLIVP